MSEDERAKKSKCIVDIYIGSDNNSRKIHDSYLDKIKKWANTTFPDGYTLVKGKAITMVLLKIRFFSTHS